MKNSALNMVEKVEKNLEYIERLRKEVSVLEERRSRLDDCVNLPEKYEELKEISEKIKAENSVLKNKIEQFKTKAGHTAEVELTDKIKKAKTDLRVINNEISSAEQILKKTNERIDKNEKKAAAMTELAESLKNKIETLKKEYAAFESRMNERKTVHVREYVEKEKEFAARQSDFDKRMDMLIKRENAAELLKKEIDVRLKELNDEVNGRFAAIEADRKKTAEIIIKWKTDVLTEKTRLDEKKNELRKMSEAMEEKSVKTLKEAEKLVKDKEDLSKQEKDLKTNWDILRKEQRKLNWDKAKLK